MRVMARAWCPCLVSDPMVAVLVSDPMVAVIVSDPMVAKQGVSLIMIAW